MEKNNQRRPQQKRSNQRRQPREQQKEVINFDTWAPKTEIGKSVKSGLITDIDMILNEGKPIMEPQITEKLMPSLESDLILIGQSKGKFGGGARRVFKPTQRKTKEGNKAAFGALAVVGDKDGHVGLGFGKSIETVPSREKSIRKAKLNVFKILRGCGSWDCGCKEAHSIPFEVSGKCGSCEITLIPAPKGNGLCVEKECAKMLALAGIKDVWSRTKGSTTNKLNLLKACEDAMKKLAAYKVQGKFDTQLGIVAGSVNKKKVEGEQDE
jgi:small subunit ribosomal protein S5